jgi:hypothetical protein
MIRSPVNQNDDIKSRLLAILDEFVAIRVRQGGQRALKMRTAENAVLAVIQALYCEERS